jgi:hypothetical protein
MSGTLAYLSSFLSTVFRTELSEAHCKILQVIFSRFIRCSKIILRIKAATIIVPFEYRNEISRHVNDGEIIDQL